jgi:hypothetical protein
MFFDNSQKKKCESCGYIVTFTKVCPATCPKCNAPLEEKNQKQNAEVNRVSGPNGQNKVVAQKVSSVAMPEKSDFQKNLLLKVNPDIVEADPPKSAQKPKDVAEMQISKSTITESDDRVKVKVKKVVKIDLENPLIELGDSGEYLRFMGVITKERFELFGSNKKFKYLLELGSNLQFIATSILSGELDRMILSPLEGGGPDEICYFLADKNFLFMIYGNFLDKKAAWLLNQMKIGLYEISQNRDVDTLEKIDQYNIATNFGKKAKFFLEEYIKLQEVFTKKKLESLDTYFRIDYFGLSFQSIGVISKIITNVLEIGGLPPVDPNDENAEEALQELKESLITAKVEAMAANTVANCMMMPNWISVKLGFQHYRFLVFSKIREYYISLLAEGNLDLKEKIVAQLHEILDEVTKQPFVGDLMSFKAVEPNLLELLKP